MVWIKSSKLIFFVCQISLLATKVRVLKLVRPIEESTRLDVIEKATKCGYYSEKHQFLSQDGYFLTLHRIFPSKYSETLKNNPVLLMHGLLCDANFFMINSCNNSLPLILSNLGYDVWLGNVRGTKYSYYNQKFSMSSDVFWNFSIDEMGKYDVPNSIQFILHQTHANKLIYMGHSQGAMIMFSAISQKPELNDQIEMFIALGPAARLSHIKGMLSYITSVSYCVYKCLGDDRNCEFIPEVFDNIKHTLSMCNYFPMWLCAKPLLMMCGNNIHDLDKNIVLKIVKNIPSSTSLKNILHFIQLIKSKKFSMYDNGEEENIKLYGTAQPPDYNISKIIVPVYIFSGEKDYLTPPQDIEWIAHQLKNVTIYHDPHMAHLDYVIGKYSSNKVFKQIVDILNKKNIF